MRRQRRPVLSCRAAGRFSPAYCKVNTAQRTRAELADLPGPPPQPSRPCLRAATSARAERSAPRPALERSAQTHTRASAVDDREHALAGPHAIARADGYAPALASGQPHVALRAQADPADPLTERDALAGAHVGGDLTDEP